MQSTESTATLMVPTMIRLVLDHLDREPVDLSSWRLLLYGGAPMPEALSRRAIASLPCRLIQGFGMTEVSLATALTAADHDRGVRLRSVGRAVPGVRIRVSGAASDGVGEVEVAGANTMAGFWRDPEATAQAYTADGWIRTGDLGHLDAGGYLSLVDRRKDMIITGGENVYSLEVEQVLASHPGVAEVAVIGLPDELWGERVHAVVARAEGCDPADLDRLAREQLAGYKVPRGYEFVDELPKTGPGKINKVALRRVGLTSPQDWQTLPAG